MDTRPPSAKGLQSTIRSARDLLASPRAPDVFYWLSVALFAVMLLTPIWQLKYLPLGDLPDHGGQMNIILNLDRYNDQYAVNWFTPYLIGYLIALFFATFVSVPVAIKLTLSLCFLAVPFFFALILRQLGGNRFWVWISFPTVYSFSVYWGFFSFIVAVPVALGVLAYIVWVAGKPLTLRHGALLAALSLLLFFAHAMAWAMGSVLGFCIFWIYNSFREAVRKFLPFAAVLPLVAVWMSGQGGPVSVPPGGYIEHYGGRMLSELNYIWEHFARRGEEDKHWMRVKELLSFAIGKPSALDYVVVSLLLMIWPLMTGGHLRWNPKYWLPLICVVVMFMIVPYWIFDTAYVYYRFAAFLVPAVIFVYAYRDGASESATPATTFFDSRQAAAYAFGFLLVFTLLLGVHRQFATFRLDDRQFQAVLKRMEPGKNVLSLARAGDSAMLFSPAYLHFGSWYQAEKSGVVLMNFSHDPHAQNVPVRYRGPEIPVPSVWDARTFDWQRHQGERYDYFLIRAPDSQSRLFKDAPYPVRLIARQGMWQVYGR